MSEGRKITANPFLTRMSQSGNTGHGNKSEARVAKSLGARLQPASGALVTHKSDATLKLPNWKFRIESKSTTNLTMALELAWLVKIGKESQQDSSIPMMTLSFVDPEGKPRSAMNAEWVMMPKVFFTELIEKLKE